MISVRRHRTNIPVKTPGSASSTGSAGGSLIESKYEVREAYKAAIADIELLSIEEARSRRDEMTKIVSHINKSYPGTDEKSFSKAQKEMDKYQFKPGEAESLLVIERGK